MPAQHLLMPEATLKILDCFYQRGALGLVKKDTRNAIDHSFNRAPAAIGNYRATCGVYFKWNHAEVFFTWKQQRLAAAGVVVDKGVRLLAQKLSLWSGQAFKPFAIRTIAYHH
jgi:hypothetical protein